MHSPTSGMGAFQNEVTEGQAPSSQVAGIRSVSEQMFEPGPAFAGGGHNLLSSEVVGNVCGGQGQYQKVSIRTRGDGPYVAHR